MPVTDKAEAKAALRAAIRARRAERSPAEMDAAGDAVAARVLALPAVSGLADAGRPGVVAVTMATPWEMSTTTLLDGLRARGHRVVTPRIEPERLLTWVELTPDTQWATGPFGIREPLGAGIDGGLAVADVVVAPALAVNARGQRLGQGGGYYDRALAAIDRDRTTVVVTVFDDEVIGDLPVEPHDLGGHVVVTPTRTIVVG